MNDKYSLHDAMVECMNQPKGLIDDNIDHGIGVIYGKSTCLYYIYAKNNNHFVIKSIDDYVKFEDVVHKLSKTGVII